MLDAIDWVEAMVDSSVLPELLASDGVVVAVGVLLAIEELDESVGEVAGVVEKFETGKPLKIDETDIATRLCKAQSPLKTT